MTQHCRVCGCSNLSACDGGCWWTEDDLCSSCDPRTGGALDRLLDDLAATPPASPEEAR